MSQRQLAMTVAAEVTPMMALHSLADDCCYQPRGVFCQRILHNSGESLLLATVVSYTATCCFSSGHCIAQASFTHTVPRSRFLPPRHAPARPSGSCSACTMTNQLQSMPYSRASEYHTGCNGGAEISFQLGTFPLRLEQFQSECNTEYMYAHSKLHYLHYAHTMVHVCPSIRPMYA